MGIEVVVGDRRRRGGMAAKRSGGHLEMVISSSAGLQGTSRIIMTKLPSCGGMFVGKGRFVHQNIPCDYIGVTVPEARGFFCDAKCCGIDQRGLRVHDPKIVKDHQRLFLIRMQMVGALAGVLVEAKRIGRYLWLDAVHLNDQKAIPWTDSRWVYLGSTDRLIDFGMLLTK